jgi:hypothetical protein
MKGRWQDIAKDCSKFTEHFITATEKKTSGSNNETIMSKARELFKEDREAKQKETLQMGRKVLFLLL